MNQTVTYCGKTSRDEPSTKGMKILNNIKAQVYTTVLCYSGNDSAYKSLIQMNDDIVITVPKDEINLYSFKKWKEKIVYN